MESTAISPSLGAPLRTRIRSVRSRQLQVDVATGVARLLIVLIFLVCAGMVWDWLVDLDFQVRALLLGVYAVAALWLVWTGILRPFTRMPSEDEVALMIERGFPDYRTRLIASVQLSRGTQQAGTSTALVRALVAETENLTRARDLRAIISMEMLATLAAFAIVLLAAVGGVIATTPNGLDFLKRTVQFAQEYPYDTRLPDSMEDISVARGDPVDHYVTARGVLPDTGQLLIYTDASQSGNAEVLIMKRLGKATDSSAGYMVQKEDAQQSYNYTIKINDGIVSGRVNVLPRPIIKNLAAEIHSPGYTGEPLRPVDLGTSQLGPVLAGSRVRLRITASKPIRRAELWLHREGNEVFRELVREFKKGEEQSSFHIDFNPGLADPRYLAFHIKLLDHRGINSRDELRYGFSVQPDDPPVLALRTPADEDEVTAQARPVVGGLAKDNYGLSQLQLHYRVTLPADAEPMEGSIDFIEQHTRRLSGEFKALAEGNHTRLPAIQDAAKQAQEAALSSENRAGLLSDAARKLDQAVAELERIKNKKPGVDQVAWQLADATSRIAADLASRAKLEGASVQLPVSIPLDFQKHLPGLAGLPLPARGQDPLTVSYWLEGRDNNTATTTEPIKSNTRTFVIVSSAQKKADLLKRMNQLIVKVEKTKEDQEELKRLTERFTGLRD